MKSLFSFSTATILSLSLFPTLLTQAKVVQKLPAFPLNALEPVVSAKSLALHLQLHARYVHRTNELIAGTILDKLPLQALVLTAPYKSELYNNSLQAYNHNFQWQILQPGPDQTGRPQGKLGLAIEKQFGGLNGLKKAFIDASHPVFAAGYVALVKQHSHHPHHPDELVVVATGDADNPLRIGQGVPILTIDLWEHAYLMDVGINRDKYIWDFFSVVKWDACERLYEGDLTLLLD